jgi:hypothetical protein
MGWRSARDKFQIIKAETVTHREFVHPPLDWVQHVEIQMNMGWQGSDTSLIR